MVIHCYFVKLDCTSAFQRNNEKVTLTEILTTYSLVSGYPNLMFDAQKILGQALQIRSIRPLLIHIKYSNLLLNIVYNFAFIPIIPASNS